MARWPKERPSTWYSQYKRGSLVSAAGAARLACRTAWLGAPHGTRGRRGGACSRYSGQTPAQHVTARRSRVPTPPPAMTAPFSLDAGACFPFSSGHGLASVRGAQLPGTETKQWE